MSRSRLTDPSRIENKWGQTLGKKAARAPSGLYGYPKSIQASCEASVRKLRKAALKIVKAAYQKDAKVADFLEVHAKRNKSVPAKVLLATLNEARPVFGKFGVEGGKTAARGRYGLYGYPARTASLGVQACAQFREAAGHIASDLHRRKAAKYERITGFLQSHWKQGKCGYSRLLHASYPDASMRLASGAEKQSGRKQAGPGAGVDVILSGDKRGYRLPDRIDYDGDLKVTEKGKVTGKATCTNLYIASYYDSAFIRNPGTIEVDDLGDAFTDEMEYVFGPEGKQGKVKLTAQVSGVENAMLSGGYVRSNAPSHFDVKGVLLVEVEDEGGYVGSFEVPFDGTMNTTPAFKEAWESLDDPDWDERDEDGNFIEEGPEKRFASGPPTTVAGWLGESKTAGSYLTVVPAHGRDYSSKAAVMKDWADNMDFLVMDMSSPWDGKPINKQDADNAGNLRAINIRYNKLRKVVVINL